MNRLTLLLFPALLLTNPVHGGRVEQKLQDTSVSISVLRTCDLKELGLADSDGVEIVNLPAGLPEGCIFGFPPGHQPADGMLRGLEVLTPQGEGSARITQVVSRDPRCFSAQEETTDDNAWSADVALQQASDHISGQIALLLRHAAPSSPEAFLNGESIEWSSQDTEGPVYLGLEGGVINLVGKDGKGSLELIQSDNGVHTVAVNDDETVTVEAIDECTTLTTTVVRTGGGGATVTGTPGGTIVPERPFIFPPVNPPFFPPEEEEEDEEPLYCTVRDGKIYTPVTREFLDLEQGQKPPLAKHHPAVAAKGVQVHSGRVIEHVSDLQVPAIGFDFILDRTYVGHMTTTQGGNFGHRWQMGIDRRITIVGHESEEDGLKVERLRGPSVITRANGSGRLDEYTAVSKEIHLVQNFNAPAPFWAHITTYQSPPGEFHEIQRYIVLQHSDMGVRPNPEQHPFKAHGNVDTTNGEAIFYVVRFPEHNQEIYNCRGQLIHQIDRFEHRQTLVYEGDINPLTHNRTLTKLTDANAREYKFEADLSYACAPFSTHYEGRLVSDACAAIPLFSAVEDPWKRRVEFEYNPTEIELARITRNFGSHTLTSGYGYSRSGEAKHLLATAYQPQAGADRPYLRNEYTAGRVVEQTLGGAKTRFAYAQDKTTVTDPNNNVIRHSLSEIAAGTVVTEVSLNGTGGVSRITRYQHNADGQVLKVTHPRGNTTQYDYYSNLGPVKIAKARMQNLLDLGITYRNSLTKGRIKQVIRRSHLQDDEIKFAADQYGYEPLYNQLLSQTDPRGNTTQYKFVYDKPGSDGQAINVLLPPRTLSDGTRQTDLSVRYEFDKHGNQIRSIDAENHAIVYSYDSTGALLRVDYPLGGSEVYKRDERGNLTHATQANGLSLNYEVDLRDLTVSSVADPGGHAIRSTFEYDKNFNLLTATTRVKDTFDSDASMKTSAGEIRREKVSQYDILNRPERETIHGGSHSIATTFRYDGNGNLIQSTLPSAKGERLTVTYAYNGANELTSVRAGNTTEDRTYDANGNLASMTDARGDRSTYRYNGLDFLIEEITPLESKVSLRLDSAGNVLTREVEGFSGLADGSRKALQRVVLTYDEFSQPMDKREYTLDGNANQRTTWLYDRLGYISEEMTRGIGTTKYERDALGRETRVIDPVGNETLLVYDSEGRVQTRTDRVTEYGDGGPIAQRKRYKKNYQTSFTYDIFGNVLTQNQGLLKTRHYWNSDGKLRGRTQTVAGRVIEQEVMHYDGLGRVVKTTGQRGTTDIAYTPSGQIKSVTTPLGTSTRDYDSLGRLISLTNADGAVVHTTFDEVGNPIKVVDANSRVTLNQYGPGGLLEFSESGTDVEQFRHDGLGRMVYAATGLTEHIQVERAFDGLGRMTEDVQIIHGKRYAVRQKFSAAQSLDGATRIRTIELPQVLGGAQLEYYLDGLNRVTSAGLGAGEPTATYYYAGRNRLAGRSLGRYDTEYRYDNDRRLKALLVHDTSTNRVVSRHDQGYEGLRNTSSVASHFTDRDGTTGRLEKHEYVYDAAGRIVESRTVLTTRAGPQATPIHRFSTERKVYDSAGQLTSISSNLATIRKEGFFAPANVARIDEVRLDRFIRPKNRGQIAHINSTVLKVNRPVSGDISIPHNEVEIMVGTASSYPHYQQKQTLGRDKNGNVIEDDQYVYKYDFRNRLIEVTDKLAKSGRLQILRTQYDPLGRPVEKTFELRHISRRVWRRQDLRFVYWENQVVGELSRDNPSTDQWQRLATYYPGGIAGEVLRMDRRRDDSLSADFVKYYPMEGVNGEITSVAQGNRKLGPIDTKPHFTGEDGATENIRDERLIADTNTRLPILARGVRYDSFLRMQYPEGSGQVTYDYRNAPGLELKRYNTENLAEIIALVEEHHPKPGVIRGLEYVVAGATLGAMGYVIVPAAAKGLALMGINGAVSASVDAGLKLAFGHPVTMRGLSESFAMGAIAGGVGSFATTLATGSGASMMREFVIGVGVDTSVGTAMDVAAGTDFSKALVANALVSVTTGTLANSLMQTAFPDAGSVARTSQIAPQQGPQAFVHPGMHPAPPLVPGIGNNIHGSLSALTPFIARLADRMPVARQFIKEWHAGELGLMPQSWSPGGNFVDRVAAYFSRSFQTMQTILAFDSQVSVASITNGVTTRQRVHGFHQSQTSARPGQILVIDPSLSPELQAVTLLHEYAHARGARELQAFHITYEAIYRLQIQRNGLNPSQAAMVTTAHQYMNAYLSANGHRGRLRVRDALGVQIRSDYKRFWEVGRTAQQARSKAIVETNPQYWVNALGAFN